MATVKTFKEISVWRKAHELVLVIYNITKDFPIEEKYVLVPQLRRAIVSVASNIVEGFHRKYSKESLKFYNYSEASLEEVKYQLLIAKDLQYIDEKKYYHTIESANEVGKMLNGWVRVQKLN